MAAAKRTPGSVSPGSPPGSPPGSVLLESTPAARNEILEREYATVRFAGDSGDGMQLAGAQFTTACAHAGNDLFTFPEIPAEIRAPVGSLAGVSGYTVCFGSRSVRTTGDHVDVLVAMNPAALKMHRSCVESAGL